MSQDEIRIDYEIQRIADSLSDLTELLETLVARTKAGRCGNLGDNPNSRLVCALPFGHTGWHECDDWESLTPGVIGTPQRAQWGKTWRDE